MPMLKKVFVEVPDKVAKGLALGDKVTVVAEGEVCELREGYEYESYPCGCPSEVKKKPEMKKELPSIGVRVTGMKLNGKNAFAELAEDDEGEED